MTLSSKASAETTPNFFQIRWLHFSFEDRSLVSLFLSFLSVKSEKAEAESQASVFPRGKLRKLRRELTHEVCKLTQLRGTNIILFSDNYTILGLLGSRLLLYLLRNLIRNPNEKEALFVFQRSGNISSPSYFVWMQDLNDQTILTGYHWNGLLNIAICNSQFNCFSLIDLGWIPLFNLAVNF